MFDVAPWFHHQQVARRIQFICSGCGAPSSKWSGRCSRCGEWNCIDEHSPGPHRPYGEQACPLAEVPLGDTASTSTGIAELDRVLGGGLVNGSVTLLGGEPGIGKSTLALQIAATRAARADRVLYCSAEESPGQVAGRAGRLGLSGGDLWLSATTDVDALCAEVARLEPAMVVVDSIQTLEVEGTNGGSTARVREATTRLVQLAKQRGLVVVVIGQVTKDGELAGPKSLEHLVDTVLSFEGDRHHSLRFLRSVKHRFGPTGEVGLFDMGPTGLSPVADPSAVFMADRATGVPGSVVVPVIEGHRPMLVEAQALVCPKAMALPRRTAQGLGQRRVSMLAAVLEQRGRLELQESDVHTSTVGGVRVAEPAADLGVLVAIASARMARVVPDDLVAVGEVGLVGEVRRVADLSRRLNEAERLGFRTAMVPAAAEVTTGLELVRVTSVKDALGWLAARRLLSATAA